MKKNFIYCSFFFFCSCKPFLIREYELDDTNQQLKKSIKEINVIKAIYNTSNMDSPYHTSFIKKIFDYENKLIKEIDSSNINVVINNYYYNKINHKLEKGILAIGENEIFNSHYIYDDKQNFVEMNSFRSDKLDFKKKYHYDNKNNKIEEIIYSPNNYYKTEKTKFYLDYKNRTRIMQGIDWNNEEKSICLKEKFNKKNRLIETELINKIKPNNYSKTINKYDKNGNLIYSEHYNKATEKKTITEVKYEFDINKNITLKEFYQNSKLISRIKFEIIYRQK